MLSAAIAVSPNPVDPRCCTKSEQLTVASGYWAAAEVSVPPELTGPDEEALNPAGKSEAGSSTDSSCVPVSWPLAAASGVIDAVGSAPADDVGAVAADVADVDCEEEGVAYGVPLVAHPATATVPATTASTASPGRERRAKATAIDGTGLPTLIRTEH